MRIFCPARGMHSAVSATNQAQFGTRNNRAGWAAVDSQDESVDIEQLIADDYAGAGTITVRVGFRCATATSGTAGIDAQIESTTPDADDHDSDSFATAQTGTTTVPNVAGETGVVTITFTQAQADNVADGEEFRIRVTRDSAVSGDFTGDMQIIWVEITS